MNIKNTNDIPEEVISSFNESIKLTEYNYKEHLSRAEKDGQLIKVESMTKHEAILFFYQYHAGTFPLYMQKKGSEYFAYY